MTDDEQSGWNLSRFLSETGIIPSRVILGLTELGADPEVVATLSRMEWVQLPKMLVDRLIQHEASGPYPPVQTDSKEVGHG